MVSPSGGGRGEVMRHSLLVAFPLSLFVNPAERLKTAPYNSHYKLAEKVDIVGTVPRTVRKAARSGTAPYSLLARVPLWRG